MQRWILKGIEIYLNFCCVYLSRFPTNSSCLLPIFQNTFSEKWIFIFLFWKFLIKKYETFLNLHAKLFNSENVCLKIIFERRSSNKEKPIFGQACLKSQTAYWNTCNTNKFWKLWVIWWKGWKHIGVTIWPIWLFPSKR